MSEVRTARLQSRWKKSRATPWTQKVNPSFTDQIGSTVINCGRLLDRCRCYFQTPWVTILPWYRPTLALTTVCGCVCMCVCFWLSLRVFQLCSELNIVCSGRLALSVLNANPGGFESMQRPFQKHADTPLGRGVNVSETVGERQEETITRQRRWDQFDWSHMPARYRREGERVIVRKRVRMKERGKEAV